MERKEVRVNGLSGGGGGGRDGFILYFGSIVTVRFTTKLRLFMWIEDLELVFFGFIACGKVIVTLNEFEFLKTISFLKVIKISGPAIGIE